MAKRGDGGGRGGGDLLVRRAEHPAQIGREHRHRRRIGRESDVGERGVEEDPEALAARTSRIAIRDRLEYGKTTWRRRGKARRCDEPERGRGSSRDRRSLAVAPRFVCAGDADVDLLGLAL